MRIHWLITSLFVLGLSMLSSPHASAEALGTTTLWDVTTTGFRPPARYDTLIHEVIEYDPGARSALRWQRSPIVINVLEGELTVFVGNRKGYYRVGQTAIIPAGLDYWFGNEGDTRLRILNSIIVAPGDGPPKIIQPSGTAPGRLPFGPAARVPVRLADVIDVVQQGAELRPGYTTPQFTTDQPNLFTVMGGQITLRYEDGTTEQYGPNQSFSLRMGQPVRLASTGAASASYFATWLPETGKPLMTAAAPLG